MPLDLQYLQFCQPGNPFYAPATPDGSAPLYDIGAHVAPGWESKNKRPWSNWFPSGWTFPRQGWKIHVSATLHNAESVLATTSRYCFEQQLPFKHIASPSELHTQNGKYADRAGAGKFITIYPKSDEQFVATLEELDSLLAGEQGPYILSDRRWREGPVHFRFGAFVPPSDGASFVSTLIDPEGVEVEDPRRPVYTPPSWATLPDSVSAQLVEDDVEFGFEMRSALHFSNGGGVYLAEATTDRFVPVGTVVVLKEARPHAGLDVDGIDAVERLRHEKEVLQALQGLDCTPVFYGSFTAWEHQYLVMEYVDGLDLKREWMTRTKTLRPAPWNLHDPEFTHWVERTVTALNDSLASIHDAGWLLGDIHPKNVLMRDGIGPCFIDFEFAHRSDPDWRSRQGAPGYEPAPGLFGVEADRWSMGIVQLDLLYPQATLADQGNAWKIEQLLRRATDDLAVPSSVGATIRSSTLDALPQARRSEIDHRVAELDDLNDHELRDEIRRGIQGLVDWSGSGPVVPGDIAVHGDDSETHRTGFPYGAAGVIGTLHRYPGSLDLETADLWLSQRVTSLRARALRGREGIEYVARTAGLPRTLDALDSSSSAVPEGPSLWSGWAGVGLANLDSQADPGETVRELTQLLADGVQGDTVGLFNGWCAAGILFAHLYESSGEDRYADLAARAINADLERCSLTTNRTLEFDEGWRTLPYLGVGSLGTGLAIIELQRATRSDVFAEQLALIDAAATYQQCAQASLAHGLAGFLIYLSRRVRHSPDPLLQDVIASHLQSLRLHAVRDETGVFFRGNQNLRLSADYLTGACGVLAALGEVLGGDSALPFGL